MQLLIKVIYLTDLPILPLLALQRPNIFAIEPRTKSNVKLTTTFGVLGLTTITFNSPPPALILSSIQLEIIPIVIIIMPTLPELAKSILWKDRSPLNLNKES